MKLLLLVAILLGFSKQTFAQFIFQDSAYSLDFQYPGTVIIPNPYKSKRDGHQSGSAAVFATQRKAGINVKSIKTKENPHDTSNPEVEYQGYEPFFLFSNNKASFEGRIQWANENVDWTNTESKNEMKSRELRGGLLIAPNMAAGLTLSNWDYDDESLGKTDQNTRDINFVRKLNDSHYMGGSLLTSNTGSPSVKHEFYTFGVGRVEGDVKQPQRAGELYLTYYNDEGTKGFLLTGRAMRNDGLVQKSLDFLLIRAVGDGVDTVLGIANVGWDFPYDEIYIAPKAGFHYSDGANTHRALWTGQVEVGQRNEDHEYFLQLKFQPEENRTSGAGAEIGKDKTTTLTIGYNTEF